MLIHNMLVDFNVGAEEIVYERKVCLKLLYMTLLHLYSLNTDAHMCNKQLPNYDKQQTRSYNSKHTACLSEHG